MEDNVKKQVALAKEGNGKAITFLYETYYKDVYYTCLKFLKDDNTTADMTQEVFLKAFSKLNSLEDEEKFKSWICQIANRMSLNYIKRSKLITFENMDDNSEISNLPDENVKTPEEISVDRDVAQVLLQAVEKLPEDQRICVFMYYYQNMSIKEIALQMGCSENTVRGKLRYASNNLRKYVENLEEDGIKLRCMGVLPFLYLIFRAEFQANTVSVPLQGANAMMKELGIPEKAGATGKIVAGGTVTTAKKAISLGTIWGILTGTFVVGVLVIVGIVFGSKLFQQKEDEAIDTQDYLSEEAVSGYEEEVLSEYMDITTHYQFEAYGEVRILGRYFCYRDGNTDNYIIKDIMTGEIIKELPQGISKLKECEDAIIFLCEREEYMDVVVLGKQQAYVMNDTAYIGDAGQDYAYFIREYAIDDLMLSKEGDFVYLSYEGGKYIIKSIDLKDGTSNYGVEVAQGVIGVKNENYIVYNDKENEVIQIRDICDGSLIASYPKEEYFLQYVRLLDEYYAVSTVENGYITNYSCYNKKGQELVNKGFGAEEKVAFFDSPGVEVATGMNILPMQKEIDGEKHKGLFRADLTPIVDYSLENADYELYYQNGYLGRHSKVYAWYNLSYTGEVFLNNGETIVEANQFLDFSNDVFIAINDDRKTVINMENGCCFEIPYNADFIKINDVCISDYKYLVKDNNNYSIYDKTGKFLFETDVPIYDSIFGRQTISYIGNSSYHIYNDVEKEQNIIYCYNADKENTQEIATEHAVYDVAAMKDENKIIYSSREGDIYHYILKDITNTEEQLLFDSEYGEIYGVSEYGFVIGKKGDTSTGELISY